MVCTQLMQKRTSAKTVIEETTIIYNHFDNDNNNFMVGFSSEQLEIGMSVFVNGSRKTSIIITPCVVCWKTYHLF